MKIRIKLLAQARSAAGCDTDEIDSDELVTLDRALLLLAEKHGSALRRILFDCDEKPHASVLLFVNEEQVHPGTPLTFRDGDELTIMPPISGG